MKQHQKAAPEIATETQARFYLIFDELAKVDTQDISSVSLEEIDEIEQVRRMVADVSCEPPRFVTST